MNLGLKGKVALITGASKGIGLETALNLAHEGANVVICARNGEYLQTAAKVITFLVSDAASYVTGTSVNIDGGKSGVL